MLVSLPNVGFNVHETSNSNHNFSLNNGPKNMKDGKELNYFEPLEKKTKKSYEKNRVFQDAWACRFPRAKLVIRENGLVF
jgi:uncharacterized lipoprotein